MSMVRPKKKKGIDDIDSILPVFRANPIRRWVESQENSYIAWKKKADKAEKEGNVDESNEFMAWAYVTDDGFYHYCRDVLGFRDMYEPFHSRMCKFIVAKGIPYYFNKRVRYVQAFRGSFKSSLISVGYSTWLIAREYVLSSPIRKVRKEIELLDKSDPDYKLKKISLENDVDKLLKSGKWLDGVNIRIGLASESLDLPSDHVQTCCTVMDSEDFQKYFGDHAPRERKKGAKWGRMGLTSTFRTKKALRDPTIWTISLEAPRTGRHFDVILADDLQAERKSSSRHQLRETWRLYGLLFPLIDPPNISNYSEMVGAATRWHEQDIYGKMEQENENKGASDQTSILKMPVCDALERAECPTIYTTEDIPSLKARGIDEFNTQYLLKPRSSKTTAFQRDWIQYYDPMGDGYRNDPGHKDSYVVIGVDVVWLEAARRNDNSVDHAVVEAWRVFPGNKWYLVAMRREQETRMDTIQYAFHLYRQLGAEKIGFSIADRKHIENDMERYEHEQRFTMNRVWVSDLSNAAVAEESHKNRKIIGTLQRMFQNKKVYIPMGLTWFEQEIMDCPMGITDDGMDAMVCAVEASRPVLDMPRNEQGMFMTPEDLWAKHTEMFLKGRPIYMNGQPIHPNKARRTSHRSIRRARNWK